MKVVIASSNKGKLAEINALLAPYHIDAVPQSDFKIPDADETGLTFIENAILKARNAAALTKLPAIADDSGLVVPALDGAPGIYSARYAGPDATDADRINKLVNAMQDFSGNERRAYFVCTIAMLRHANDPAPIISQGFWHGEVLREPRGANGFGYDPIMYFPKQMKTSAELPPELKNTLSHRGQAMRQFLQQYNENENQG